MPKTALDGFREGLREAGWYEGRNLLIRTAFGPEGGTLEATERVLAQLATDLVNLKVDVIFASPAPAARAAKRVGRSVPIVFAGVSDRVGREHQDGEDPWTHGSALTSATGDSGGRMIRGTGPEAACGARPGR